MKIAIDIDNTIVDYRYLIIYYLSKYNKEFLIKNNINKNLSVNNIKETIKICLGDDFWQKIQSYIYSSKENVFFYEGAEDAIESLADLGYELHFVSHKSKYGLLSSENVNIREIASERIINWFYENNLKKFVTSICFCESFEEKLRMLNYLDPKIIIDDLVKIHLFFIENLNDIENKHFLFFNGSSENNKLLKNNFSKKIIELNTWSSITKYVEKLI